MLVDAHEALGASRKGIYRPSVNWDQRGTLLIQNVLDNTQEFIRT